MRTCSIPQFISECRPVASAVKVLKHSHSGAGIGRQVREAYTKASRRPLPASPIFWASVISPVLKNSVRQKWRRRAVPVRDARCFPASLPSR